MRKYILLFLCSLSVSSAAAQTRWTLPDTIDATFQIKGTFHDIFSSDNPSSPSHSEDDVVDSATIPGGKFVLSDTTHFSSTFDGEILEVSSKPDGSSHLTAAVDTLTKAISALKIEWNV